MIATLIAVLVIGLCIVFCAEWPELERAWRRSRRHRRRPKPKPLTPDEVPKRLYPPPSKVDRLP